jgi:hypothetical protein
MNQDRQATLGSNIKQIAKEVIYSITPQRSSFMPALDKQYLNLGYWFLGFVVLAIVAFYPTYFGVWSFTMPKVMHLHAAFMTIWIALLITQPILIKRKKYFIHRTIGKLSYVLFPLIILSAYLMMRHSFYNQITTKEADSIARNVVFNRAEFVWQLRGFMLIALLYFFWFITFYVLAIVNRKAPMAHAQYMIAAALTLMGPTIDRIVYTRMATPIAGFIPGECVAFAIILISLLFLMWYDYRKGYSMKTITVCITLYLAGQIGFFVLGNTKGYQYFVSLLLP